MNKRRTWRHWATLAPAAAALALLGGCVVAPTDPWEVGTPVVTSGSIYYGSTYRAYPDYYYPAPSLYYPASSRRYARPAYTHGNVRRGHRPGVNRPGHSGARPDRGASHQRPGTRRPAGNGNRGRAEGNRPHVGTTPRLGGTGGQAAHRPMANRGTRGVTGVTSNRSGPGGSARGGQRGGHGGLGRR